MARDREAYNAYQRERRKLEYAENVVWVRALKIERGCTDCGYNGHHAGLEFDHLEGRNGDVTRTVARLMGKTRKRLEEEIAKCEVVCKTCHGIRTFNRQQAKLNQAPVA